MKEKGKINGEKKSRVPKVSIVVPTWNEEKWLPKLLTSLEHQTFKDFEVIVADKDSSDGTRAIAKKFGAHVTDGGLPGRGRNMGAKEAQGEILFFIDADVVPPKDFLEKVVEEFTRKRADIATTYIVPRSRHFFDIIFYLNCNIGVFLLQKISPIAHGLNIIITRKAFEESGGFDESLVAGEDFELTRRVSKGRKFSLLHSTKTTVSVRRFKKLGRTKLFFHLLFHAIWTLIFNRKLKNSKDYDWTGYDDGDSKESHKKGL